MLLVIDTGNTHTVVGIYDDVAPGPRSCDSGLVDHWRLATDPAARERIVDSIRRLDAAVAAHGGTGFAPTPFAPSPALADAIGLPGGVELWLKDETGNVSGSR